MKLPKNDNKIRALNQRLVIKPDASDFDPNNLQTWLKLGLFFAPLVPANEIFFGFIPLRHLANTIRHFAKGMTEISQ